MAETLKDTTPEHQTFFIAVRDLSVKHAAHLPFNQQVIVLSQFIGHLALVLPAENQKELAAVVARNLTLGFQDALMQNIDTSRMPKQ